MQPSQNELAASLMTTARHFDGAEFENNIKSIIITGGVISAPQLSMTGSIHFNIILLYNLFPFQVLFLCILKVWMIQIKTSYHCGCNGKILSIFRSQVASGHLDKTVRFWDIR